MKGRCEMKQTINEHEFVKAFDDYDRGNNFSVAGRKAMYNWFVEYEEACDTNVELDVIAICCEFTEYEGMKELKESYEDIKDMDDLRDNTQVIEIEGAEGFIIQSY